jgi:hypothetical protein
MVGMVTAARDTPSLTHYTHTPRQPPTAMAMAGAKQRLCGMMPVVPATDYGCDSASCHQFSDGYLLTQGQVKTFWNAKLSDPHTEQHHHYVSPLRCVGLCVCVCVRVCVLWIHKLEHGGTKRSDGTDELIDRFMGRNQDRTSTRHLPARPPCLTHTNQTNQTNKRQPGRRPRRCWTCRPCSS